jgi:hypothetical protein
LVHGNQRAQDGQRVSAVRRRLDGGHHDRDAARRSGHVEGIVKKDWCKIGEKSPGCQAGSRVSA